MLHQHYSTPRSLPEPFTDLAQFASKAFGNTQSLLGKNPLAQRISAGYDLLHRLGKDYEKPEFGLRTIDVDGVEIAIHERIELSKPFCELRRFKRFSDDPATLAKLKDPDSGSSERIPVSEWWREMQRTNAFSEAVFVVEGEVKELRIPGALFSHAAENLLQNAFDKKVVEVGVTVTLILRFLDAGRVSLTVTDTGSPVPSRISDDIGIRPVVSEKGFGIGLYQLARSAALSGYQLVLRTNEPGCGTWVLEPV